MIQVQVSTTLIYKNTINKIYIIDDSAANRSTGLKKKVQKLIILNYKKKYIK
jgi:hypothetical protein